MTNSKDNITQKAEARPEEETIPSPTEEEIVPSPSGEGKRSPATEEGAATDRSLLIETALLAGEILLESGGETFRAEETAAIICRSGGDPDGEVFFLPTGIFISGSGEDRRFSTVKRVGRRSVNLFRVERVNFYSRAFAEGKLSLPQLREKLLALKNNALYSRPALCLAAGLSSALFTVLFEPTLSLTVLFDFLVSFVGAFAAQLLCLSGRMKNVYPFSTTFLGSALIALFAVLFCSLFGIGNVNVIIIGAIMPLLPGMSLTNAIRDTVTGDLISGVSRIAETLLLAAAIAGGVGFVLACYLSITGGPLL